MSTSSHFPPTPLFLSSPKRSQGALPCGKSKALPAPSRSIKVSIQTKQAPTKSVHAVESKPRTFIWRWMETETETHIGALD